MHLTHSYEALRIYTKNKQMQHRAWKQIRAHVFPDSKIRKSLNKTTRSKTRFFLLVTFLEICYDLKQSEK